MLKKGCFKESFEGRPEVAHLIPRAGRIMGVCLHAPLSLAPVAHNHLLCLVDGEREVVVWQHDTMLPGYRPPLR